MKRRLSFVLSLALVFVFALGGCGEKESFVIPYSEYNLKDYIKLGEYKGLEMKKADTSVSDEELNSEIENRLEQAKESVEIKTGVVKQGDTVNIDYEGKVDGKKFDGGSAKGADLEIGSGHFIPGFEEGLVGVNVGETKVLKLKFPAEYHESTLAGKDTEFKVKVNSIKEYKVPVLDEAFAKKNGSDSVEDYRSKVKAELKKNKKIQNEDNQVGELWEEIHSKTEVKKYPEKEIKRVKADYVKNIENMAKQYGKSYEEFLQMANMSDKNVQKEAKKYAEATVKSELMLFAIAEKEGYKVTSKEFNKELDNVLKAQKYNSYKEMKKAMGKDFDEEAFKNQIVMQLTVKHVVDVIKKNAVMVD